MIGPYVNVAVEFVGKREDGTVFDSSEKSGVLEFTTEGGQVIEGLDKAVQSMDVGETRTFTIPAAQAFGEYDKYAVQKRELRYIPNAEDLPVGEYIDFFGPVGQRVPAKVLKVDDEYAWLDFNHKLAGQDVTYEVTVKEILPDKTRRTPLSSYGGMARTAATRPVKEQLVFNNFLERIGLSPQERKKLDDESLVDDADL